MEENGDGKGRRGFDEREGKGKVKDDSQGPSEDRTMTIGSH